jgi:tripartite-type tricarboxylate transporter receptor subunit TctC
MSTADYYSAGIHFQKPRRIMSLLRFLATLLAFAPVAFSAAASAAGAAFPQKPVTLVVGFSPGSSIDLVARTLGSKLSAKLGQTVIVENKPGAGGNIASAYVAHSKPDGYTLLVVANNVAISPSIYHDLTFNAQRDLRALAYIGIGPVILKVNNRRGFKSLRDLVDYAKAHPGELTFGSSGVGGTPHMAGVLFQQVAGVKLTHIPYKGGADALGALLGGQVDLLINPLLGDVDSDRVTSLAITGQARSPLAPNIPTFGELGYPGYNIGVYYGVMGPRALPADIVTKINASVNETLADPAVIDTLTTRSGIVLKAETANAFQRFLDKDTELWADLVKRHKGPIE